MQGMDNPAASASMADAWNQSQPYVDQSMMPQPNAGQMPNAHAATPPIADAGGATPDQFAEGGEVTKMTKKDWFGAAMISLFVVGTIIQITLNLRKLNSIKKEEKDLSRDINEVKFNVKKVMKDDYETLT